MKHAGPWGMDLDELAANITLTGLGATPEFRNDADDAAKVALARRVDPGAFRAHRVHVGWGALLFEREMGRRT